MKKFILAMFILSLIALQLPYYTIDGVTTSLNIKSAAAMISVVGAKNAIGNFMVYIIPLIGVIISFIDIIIRKNIAVLSSIIGIIGMFYCGFVFFFVTGLKGNVNFGFIISFFCYLMVLTFSIVSIRMKEN